KFGREYIIPKPFDHRVLTWEAAAVAKAAIDSGVAQNTIDIEEYRHDLKRRVGKGRIIMDVVIDKARKNLKKIVFPEGDSSRILRAAHILAHERIANPIVLGTPEKINTIASEHEIDLSGIEILDYLKSEKRQAYSQKYFERRKRRGMTLDKAKQKMNDRNYFGIMMLDQGDCDAVLSGVTADYSTTIRPTLQIIDLKPDITRVSGLFAMIHKDKVYMIADTTVNINPTAEELAEIALCSANVARAFNIEPRIAMLSFSNFGSVKHEQAKKVALATKIVKSKDPGLMADGEMQADTALMPELMQKYYPFSKLTEEANVFVCPDLTSGNIAYKLLQRIAGLTAVGPILLGLSKPVHVLHRALDVNQIVDMAAIAAVDAQAKP
ncbi:MAG: NADP-dependent malic enzyme, partial [Candidatus Zixiibacteriota bacterium]